MSFMLWVFIRRVLLSAANKYLLHMFSSRNKKKNVMLSVVMYVAFLRALLLVHVLSTFIWLQNTLITLNIGTDRPEQTV